MGNEQSLIRFFTQCPHLILYGLPDVPMQDKWALLALMGMCWDRSKGNKTLKDLEGPYKLSLREISTITGVKHTILRNKEGKEPREGVLDRWQRLGYMTTIDARPIDEATGKPGRPQTYLYIHLEKIWRDNAKFTENWRFSPNKIAQEGSFQVIYETTVNHVNSQDEEKEGATVNYVNHTVSLVNSHVNEVNHTVNGASAKSAQYQVDNFNTENTNTSPHPNKIGAIRIAMSECLKLFGDENNSTHLVRAHEMYWQYGGMPMPEFRVKVNQAVNDVKINGGGMEYFVERLAHHLRK